MSELEPDQASGDEPEGPQGPDGEGPGGDGPASGGPGGRDILPVNIEDELRQSYLDYAMSVIVGRALPDVRDGLKPVHRRVLFTMNELNNTFNRPYMKSARVVGDVITFTGRARLLGSLPNYLYFHLRSSAFFFASSPFRMACTVFSDCL